MSNHMPKGALASMQTQMPAMSAEERDARATRIGGVLASKRDEAMAARQLSGIESIWMRCEEAYLGIDDENRSEFSNAKWAKPTSMDGPVTTGRRAPNDYDVRSTAYVGVTARYVDAGSAKIAEIILPVDDKAFSFDATPVPDLIKSKNDLRIMVHSKTGEPLVHAKPPKQPEIPQQPGQQAQDQQPKPVTVADLAERAIAEAGEKAKKAETRIYDWMVECNHPAEMRKILFDAARIGVGVLKGPVPREVTATAVSIDEATQSVVLQQIKSIKPCTKWVDPWNVFPDSACGESIQDGDYIFERDYIGSKKLRELKRDDSYNAEAIDRVLLEGPGKIHVDNNDPHRLNSRKDKFEIWYYYGLLKKEDMLAICDHSDDKEESFAIVTLVNDTVIRAVINPMESGKFPYHSFPWRRRAAHWAGVGVAEQCFTPQTMLNAATRAMLNNAGKSAGSQIVVDTGQIKPADNRWVMTPDKIWQLSADATVDDVRKAFATFQIPNTTAQLMSVIQYAFRLAEESTNIPLITQGQSGSTTPDTFGAAQLQNNNANQLLRSIGYAVDDCITVPIVNMFYEWLLLDPEVPDDEKGDFTINANGSSALVERAIQDQTILQMGSMVGNPAFGINPKKWFAEMAKSKHLDPRTFQYTEDEMAQMAQQPAPQDPRMQVAQLQAQVEQGRTMALIQSEEKLAQLRAQIEQMKLQAEMQKAQAVVQADLKMDDNNYQARMQELQIKERLAMLDYANTQKIKIEEVKAQLADTAMRLKVQKELAGIEQVIKPAVEPQGRTPNGQAFTK